MNGNIGYITENMYDFSSIQSIHHFESATFNETYDILIVQQEALSKALSIINKVRRLRENQAIIWMIDYKDCLEIHKMMTQVIGSGRVYTACDLAAIDMTIERILHPNLPFEREEIAFVIPVYNEEKRMHHVKHFIEKIVRFKETLGLNMTIYFMDDGSSDDSVNLIEEATNFLVEMSDCVEMKAPFMVKRLLVNTRKAGTYIEAFKQVSENTIIFADADDGYDFEDVVRMLNLINQGYFDIVVGTKDLYSENRRAIRRFVSFMKRLLTKPLLPDGVSDSQTGLKVFKRHMLFYLIDQLNVKHGLAIDLNILNMAKKRRLRVYEMPVRFIDRDDSHVDVLKDSLKFIKSIMAIILERHKEVIH